ncbi:LysR substrate-binding domain-containing protein [Komagataeibacter rhaeticus]|nr:LysR substrate-binding domain-containing protein [Komagataeibacter rhaeticus]
MLSRIEDLKGLRRGVIRLSSISAIAAEELPRLIADFQQSHPDVTFDITIAGSDDVVRSVVEDETDCGIAFNPLTPPSPYWPGHGSSYVRSCTAITPCITDGPAPAGLRGLSRGAGRQYVGAADAGSLPGCIRHGAECGATDEF